MFGRCYNSIRTMNEVILMDSYVTGSGIRTLREQKGMTQAKLAEKLGVSDKAVSKWETGKGYPDITLLDGLAALLGVSVTELLAGVAITNRNRSFNMKRSKMYVCPVCGNVIFSSGEAVISCCGITLIPEEAEEADGEHAIRIERVEDEYYITADHEMTKEHYLSFFAAITDNGIQLVKLYPEGNAEARFKINRTYAVYAYCNRHGLFMTKLPM